MGFKKKKKNCDHIEIFIFNSRHLKRFLIAKKKPWKNVRMIYVKKEPKKALIVDV